MCVVGTDEDAPISPELLKANPNIGLNVFDQMADMYRTVGIGQGRSNQDLATGLGCRISWSRGCVHVAKRDSGFAKMVANQFGRGDRRKLFGIVALVGETFDPGISPENPI